MNFVTFSCVDRLFCILWYYWREQLGTPIDDLCGMVIRTSPSEFVIPYHKYLKSLECNLMAGCHFKMKFESEESSERKYVADRPSCLLRDWLV